MLGLLYTIVITLGPVMIYQWVKVKLGRTLTNTHRNCTYVLALYVWAVFLVTGIGSIYDVVDHGGIINSFAAANISFVPFQEGFLVTALLNVVLFMPLGFGLPHVWTNFRDPLKTVLVGLGFSILIECAQIPTNRAVDLEDVLMNTVGTLLGYVFWKTIGNYVFQGHVSRRIVALSNNEPLVYIAMVFIAHFFFYNWRWFLS